MCEKSEIFLRGFFVMSMFKHVGGVVDRRKSPSPADLVSMLNDAPEKVYPLSQSIHLLERLIGDQASIVMDTQKSCF